MFENEDFERLKQNFIADTADTEKHLQQIKSLSFEEIDSTIRPFLLTDHRAKAVKSSTELYFFINGKRIQQVDEKMNRLKIK